MARYLRQPCFQNLFTLKNLQQNSSFSKHFVSVAEPSVLAREQTLIQQEVMEQKINIIIEIFLGKQC